LRKRDLESLGLTCKHRGRQVPTVAGIILFGKDRLRHFPDAWIQAGAFAGTDKGGNFLDRKEFRGYAFAPPFASRRLHCRKRTLPTWKYWHSWTSPPDGPQPRSPLNLDARLAPRSSGSRACSVGAWS
jgi:hypothetical protein